MKPTMPAPADPSAGIVGHRFPSVAGHALSGELVRFPEDTMGAPALLLCAYRRGTQDDIDRWAAFVGRELPDLAVYELPIIPALVWRPFQGMIDGGMRGGVPRRQWSRVVTLYDQGDRARSFLGDSGGHRTQLVLLDAAGVVAFHDAGGFREGAARALVAAVLALSGDETH
jgi:hypothetical protein